MKTWDAWVVLADNIRMGWKPNTFYGIYAFDTNALDQAVRTALFRTRREAAGALRDARKRTGPTGSFYWRGAKPVRVRVTIEAQP